MKFDFIKKLWPDTRNEWLLVLFVIAGGLMSALLGWQLLGTEPGRWCGLASATSPEGTSACLQVLQSLITVKDHGIIGLLMIVGLTVVSLTAVVLGVNVKATGPGGTSVDVGADETKVKTEETTITIPTPPSEEK